jgi:mRNA interferase MazF
MSIESAYCPDAGDIIWINFDPQSGREQAGRRPAFVLSAKVYNAATRLCVLCPVTSKVKGFRFEVPLPAGYSIQGVVLTDQIKSLDWSLRNAAFADKCVEINLEVAARLRALLQL